MFAVFKLNYLVKRAVNRPTAEEAMEHPYLKQYHDPSDEPVSPPLDIDSDGYFFL